MTEVSYMTRLIVHMLIFTYIFLNNTKYMDLNWRCLLIIKAFHNATSSLFQRLISIQQLIRYEK